MPTASAGNFLFRSNSTQHVYSQALAHGSALIMAGRSRPSLSLAHNIKADTQCLIVFKTVLAG